MQSAEAETAERGKVEGLLAADLATLYETLGLGALKFYLLKVQPHKKMLFDPAESVSLQGDTGPFVQYTYARIHSLLAKATQAGHTATRSEGAPLNTEERLLARRLQRFALAVQEAALQLDPSQLCAYLLDLAKDYNRFYYAHPILREENPATLSLRLQLSQLTASYLKAGMGFLGIQVPDRM